MNIRELLIRIGVTGTQETDRKISNLDRRVDSLKESFRGLGGIITAAFGVMSLTAISNAADEMQSLESRIGMLPQTVGSVADAFDRVASKASENRLPIAAYAEVYTRIGNAAQEYLTTADELEQVTTTLAQALVVGGASASEQASAFLQFSQALGAGTLQGDEFRSMAEAAPQFLDQLAKAIGVPRGELKKLASDGKLTTKQVIEATKQMSGYFNQAFKQIPMTISQALVIVNNRFEMMVNRFNRASGGVTYAANAILTAMDYVERGVDAVTDVLGGAENAVKILTVALGATGLVGAVWALNAALGVLFSPIGLVIAALTALYLVGQDVYTWFKGGPSVIGDMIGPVSDYKEGIENLTNALADLRDMAIWALRKLNDLANFFNSGQDLAEEWGEKTGAAKVGPWIKEKLGWLAGDLGKWGSYLNNKTYGVFDVPQMWTDAQIGIEDSNRENAASNKRNSAFKSRYTGLDEFGNEVAPPGMGFRDKPLERLPLVIPEGFSKVGHDINSPTVTGAPTNNVTVHIGNIDARGSESAEDSVRRAAVDGITSVLNAPVGFNRDLGESLNFAGGGH